MYTFCLHSADGICIFAATSEVIMTKVLILDLGGAESDEPPVVVEQIIVLARRQFHLEGDDTVIVDNERRLFQLMSNPSELVKFLGQTYRLFGPVEVYYVKSELMPFAAPVSLLDSLAASLMRDVCGTCPDKDDCPLCRECPQKDTCSECIPPGH